MLKSKESRDTVLLIFMAAITIAFLLYVFFPSGKEKENPKDNENQNPNINSIKKSPLEIKLPEETEPTEERILEEFNEKTVTQLKLVCTNILESDIPFQTYNIENLKSLLLNSGNTLVEKLYKFSFFDLNDIARLEFPEGYSDSLKFNLFVSLFLIKIQEEMIEAAFLSLPNVEVEKLINFDIYRLVNYEIETDYQFIPILFYFKHLVRQSNLYPDEDGTRFFKEGIKKMRDLSDSKYLVKIQEFMAFSQRKEKFRIEWVEEDGFFSDDKKVYKNLNLNIINFFKQDYLIFPDTGDNENNRWIKELCRADSGGIELKLLRLQNEDPSRPANIHKIIYTPIGTQFVIILNEYTPPPVEGVISRIVKMRMTDFLKNFTILDFSRHDMDAKVFQQELKQFGNYLKKNIPRTND